MSDLPVSAGQNHPSPAPGTPGLPPSPSGLTSPGPLPEATLPSQPPVPPDPPTPSADSPVSCVRLTGRRRGTTLSKPIVQGPVSLSGEQKLLVLDGGAAVSTRATSRTWWV